jgi:hypothetical protein
VVPTVKQGQGVMVWGCFAGDTVGDLFRIQGTLNQHGYDSILQRYAIPSGLRLVGLSFVFQQDNDPHTSRLCKGYLTKKQSDGVLHQMTWPPQSPDLNSIERVWDELTAVGRKSSQQVLSICGNSFKTFGKHSRCSWWRECQECAKLSSRQRVATLKSIKYILFCLKLFWLLQDSMCYFIVLMSSLLFYNVENSKKSRKTLE